MPIVFPVTPDADNEHLYNLFCKHVQIALSPIKDFFIVQTNVVTDDEPSSSRFKTSGDAEYPAFITTYDCISESEATVLKECLIEKGFKIKEEIKSVHNNSHNLLSKISVFYCPVKSGVCH